MEGWVQTDNGERWRTEGEEREVGREGEWKWWLGGEASGGGETQENSVTFLRHSGKAIIDIWPPPAV